MVFGTSNVESSAPARSTASFALGVHALACPLALASFEVQCWMLDACSREAEFDVSLFPRLSILPDDFEDEDENENDLSRILHLASPIPQTPDPAPAFPRSLTTRATRASMRC